MPKLISRVCCLFLVVLVIAASLPFSAFAVDPVSVGVMANAFAQAIAAYGASNGVALTFDVASTDGIGESVHELWKDFREGTQSADDYATLAAALFPDLYYKASSVVAGAADVYTVGYNISSTYAEEFDNFYNWLLSGPAEMTKVDNQYYQFSQAQIGESSVPIKVGSFNGTFPGQPIGVYDSSLSAFENFNKSFKIMDPFVFGGQATQYGLLISVPLSYAFLYGSNIVWCSLSSSFTSMLSERVGDSYNPRTQASSNVSNKVISGSTVYYRELTWGGSFRNQYLPVFASLDEGLTAALGVMDGTIASDTVGVKAYTNTGVAQFPDSSDPNYDAIAKQIPSTYPWNDSLYGDGTGALTDAQAGAIAGSVDDAIAVDGVVDLAGTREETDEPGTDDPPSDDPDDYVVPGLADIFPFCIPFDIYNFLSALAAAPVAPHFTATLDFPEAVGGTQTIDIDFDSPTWNQLAQLLRLLELLAFIIGLAFVTRSMFIRG